MCRVNVWNVFAFQTFNCQGMDSQFCQYMQTMMNQICNQYSGMNINGGIFPGNGGRFPNNGGMFPGNGRMRPGNGGGMFGNGGIWNNQNGGWNQGNTGRNPNNGWYQGNRPQYGRQSQRFPNNNFGGNFNYRFNGNF